MEQYIKPPVRIEPPTRIEFLPVCSHCQHIIRRPIDYEEHSEPILGGKYHYRVPHFDPPRCPNCGKMFESVIMPTRLPFPGGY